MKYASTSIANSTPAHRTRSHVITAKCNQDSLAHDSSPTVNDKLVADIDLRRGVALVFGLILAVLSLLILTAITVDDFGYIHVARTELRRSADSAAMSGCWELFDRIRASGRNSVSPSHILDASNAIAALNSVGERNATLGEVDLQVGKFGLDGSWTSGTSAEMNAVQVTLRRSGDSNGELPLFFGKLTGRNYQSLSATATAAMFSAIDGFEEPDSSDETLDIIPLALDLESWVAATEKRTVDAYSYTNGQVHGGSDGVWETNLYPKGTGSPGNRGTVDIGGAKHNSTNDLSRQILHGVIGQDLIDLGKPLKFDYNGELDLNGDTGISAGIKDELATLIGKTRIIPIYKSVAGNGNNANYTIVRWEGVRILAVKLTGKKDDKHVIVQPATVVARNARIDYSGSRNSSHLLTPVMLVE